MITKYALLITLTALCLIQQSSGAWAETQEQCQLKLGWGNWPPYQTDLNAKEPYGIQIDLVKTIAHEAECSLIFVKNTFNGNLDAVKQGTVDFIMDTSVNSERESFGWFSEPYRLEVMVLYLRSDLEEQCQSSSFDELLRSQVRIGLNQGNIYGEEVTKAEADKKLSKNFVYVRNNDQLFERFAKGDIDGFFEDPTVLAYNLRQKQMSQKLKACKITQRAGTVSFLFSKKTTSPLIVKRFNEALARVKQTSEYMANWAW